MYFITDLLNYLNKGKNTKRQQYQTGVVVSGRLDGSLWGSCDPGVWIKPATQELADTEQGNSVRRCLRLLQLLKHKHLGSISGAPATLPFLISVKLRPVVIRGRVV